MPTVIAGEQKPSPLGVLGPLLYSGSLAANTPTDLVVPGSATYRALIPLLTAGRVWAISAYRNSNTTAGDITLQLGVLAAAANLSDPLQALAGAALTLPAAGGAAYAALTQSPPTYQANSSLGITLTAASAGTALLTAYIFVGA